MALIEKINTLLLLLSEEKQTLKPTFVVAKLCNYIMSCAAAQKYFFLLSLLSLLTGRRTCKMLNAFFFLTPTK